MSWMHQEDEIGAKLWRMPVMELKGEDGLQSTVTSSMTREVRSGKYSKRRRSNVAVIHVRIIFIVAFLFYCLLLNHSFQTNPNSITNCFKTFLFLSIATYNYIAPASLFDF